MFQGNIRWERNSWKFKGNSRKITGKLERYVKKFKENFKDFRKLLVDNRYWWGIYDEKKILENLKRNLRKTRRKYKKYVSVRRVIFRNVEERVDPYFVCNMSNCVTVRPVMGHLTPKINIAFFIRNLMPNICLFDNFFEKSCIFRENGKKTVLGAHLTIF